MKTATLAFAAATLAVTGLASCATLTTSDAVRAPEPAKPITDVAGFYSGRWYEIGRTPLRLTDGCVAGYTDYLTKGSGLVERDGCRAGTPMGKEKSVAGPLRILNPGQNTKVHVSYRLLGVWPAPRTYWMLDHGPGWFIMSDPAFENLNLYTRDPRPSATQVAQLNARVTALGYDVRRLEYPATLPPGMN